MTVLCNNLLDYPYGEITHKYVHIGWDQTYKFSLTEKSSNQKTLGLNVKHD